MGRLSLRKPAGAPAEGLRGSEEAQERYLYRQGPHLLLSSSEQSGGQVWAHQGSENVCQAESK